MYTSSFFNSVKGDRKYKADAFAEYFASFIGNGVFPNPSDGLQTMASTGMTVAIKTGRAWINGYFFRNFDDTPVILATANGTYDRIDRVVLRWSLADRSIDIAVKQGTYSATPAPEPLRRDTDIYELAIADVLVPKGAVTITQANITDTRLNSELCGIVRGTIEEVDTTTIFNQYNDWYRTFTNEAQSEFMDWFESIRDILDENTAAHLLNMINGKQDRITASGMLKSDGTTVTAAVPGVDYASGDALSKINRVVLTGSANTGDTVALARDGSVVSAVGGGLETLTYTQNKAFDSGAAPLCIQLTETKFANVYHRGSAIYCSISDFDSGTVTYGAEKLLYTVNSDPSGFGACRYDVTSADAKVLVVFQSAYNGTTMYICFSVNLSSNLITLGTAATFLSTRNHSIVCVSPAANIAIVTSKVTESSYLMTYARRCVMSGLTISSTVASSGNYYECRRGNLAPVSSTMTLFAGLGSTVSYLCLMLVSTASACTMTQKDNLTNLFGINSPLIAITAVAPNKALILGSYEPDDAPYADRKAVIVSVDASGNVTYGSVFTLRDYTKCSVPVANIADCGGGYYKAYSAGLSLIIKLRDDLTAVDDMWLSHEMPFGSAPWAFRSGNSDILTWFESASGKQTAAHQYNDRILGIVESTSGDELTVVSRGEYITENLEPGADYYLQGDGTLGTRVTFRKMGAALTDKRLLLKEGSI